jgi:uncharacterized membrane protein
MTGIPVAQQRIVGQEATLRWARRCTVALVVVGCVFRFSGLGSKVVWNDETHTGLSISGTSYRELRERVFDGGVRARHDVMAYQFPRADRTVVDTVDVLIQDQPKHPPLYFVMVRLWVQAFGSSAGVMRSLSAFLGLLSLPLLFLVCRELVDDEVFAWVAVGLVSISPLHVVYSQEARQYVLWLDLVLLASWSLLRAVRDTRDDSGSGIRWYALYSVALALALYTHLLAVFVAFAHTLFAIGVERFRATAVVRRAAVSLAVTALLISPWGAVLLVRSSNISSWASWAAGPISTSTWLAKTLYGVSKVFIDMNRLHETSVVVFVAVAGAPLLVAALCAIHGLRSASRQARWFVVTLSVAYWAPLFASDLIRDSWRATVTRYQFPAVIGLQLCVAVGISALLASGTIRRRGLGVAAATLLAVCGVVSGSAHSRAGGVWWNKFNGEPILAAAQHVNRYSDPLVVASEYRGKGRGNALALAHAVDDHVRLLYMEEPMLPLIPDGRKAFVWDPTPNMLERLREMGWNARSLGTTGLHELTRE